jgi:hypothetical protein
VPVAPLAREVEAQAVGSERAARAAVRREQSRSPEHTGRVVAVVQHDDVIALRHDREVPVGDRGVEHALGEDPVEPVPQARPALGLDELLVRPSALAAAGLQPPLPHEGRPLVEERGVVGERDAADDARPPERRGGHGIVGCHVRPRRHRLGLGEGQTRPRGVDALLQRRQADGIRASPRATRTSGSMRARPSNASFA